MRALFKKLPFMILFACLFLISYPSLAQMEDRDSDPLREIERDLKEEIVPIIHAFDVGAFVSLEVAPKLDQQDFLPGTPYLLKDRVIRNSTGRLQLKQITISITTRLEKIPASLVKMIRKAIPYQKINLEIKRIPYPPELLAAASASPLSDSRSPEWIKPLIETISDKVTPYLYLFGGICLVSVLFFIFSELSKRNLFITFRDRLTSEIRELSSLSQSGLGNGERSDSSDKSKSSAYEPGMVQPRFSPDFFPIEILLACMTDCYWSELDAYASFLWKQISSPKRKELVERLPLLLEYSAYLASVEEEDFGWIDEPAYLNPLPLEKLNNEQLTKEVKKYPELILFISTIRRNALMLNAVELLRLKIQSSAKGQPQKPPAISWAKIPASPPRALKRNWKIEIKNVNEESEILSFSQANLDVIESIPSLGWMLRLERPEIENILSQFTARELAYAWVGPQDVLNSLASYLPPKKLELLQNYLQSDQPSRNSRAYTTIHQLTVSTLQTKENAGNPAHAAA